MSLSEHITEKFATKEVIKWPEGMIKLEDVKESVKELKDEIVLGGKYKSRTYINVEELIKVIDKVFGKGLI